MRPKITSKENWIRDAERRWHCRAPRHGGTVPKLWQEPPKTGQAALACHLAQSCHRPCLVGFRGPTGYCCFDSLGLPCDAFSRLNSPSWHYFLL